MDKYFVAIIVYKAISTDKNLPLLFEEATILIKANHRTDAEKKVNAAIKNREVDYENEVGATISWRLLKVIDINEMLDDSISDVTDVYSRHFTDITAYGKFEQAHFQMNP